MCELPLFFAGIRQAVRRWKALNLGSLNIQFQQDWQKDEKITALLKFLPENRKILLDWALWCASRGINNFSLPQLHQPYCLQKHWIIELKYAFFSRTGRNTKKLRRSNLFQSTIFKHGLLEGSTILLQYSYISHTKLESSLLGELKCAISAEYDVTLKNKSIRKCKKWHCATNVHGHCSMGYQRDRNFFLNMATQAVHRWITLY